MPRYGDARSGRPESRSCVGIDLRSLQRLSAHNFYYVHYMGRPGGADTRFGHRRRSQSLPWQPWCTLDMTHTFVAIPVHTKQNSVLSEVPEIVRQRPALTQSECDR